jgi:hypothetical protein
MNPNSSRTSATLTVGNKTFDLPISSNSVGPDVIDIGKLYAQSVIFNKESLRARPAAASELKAGKFTTRLVTGSQCI